MARRYKRDSHGRFAGTGSAARRAGTGVAAKARQIGGVGKSLGGSAIKWGKTPQGKAAIKATAITAAYVGVQVGLHALGARTTSTPGVLKMTQNGAGTFVAAGLKVSKSTAAGAAALAATRRVSEAAMGY